jgi:uncharacterized membrane protein
MHCQQGRRKLAGANEAHDVLQTLLDFTGPLVHQQLLILVYLSMIDLSTALDQRGQFVPVVQSSGDAAPVSIPSKMA